MDNPESTPDTATEGLLDGLDELGAKFIAAREANPDTVGQPVYLDENGDVQTGTPPA